MYNTTPDDLGKVEMTFFSKSSYHAGQLWSLIWFLGEGVFAGEEAFFVVVAIFSHFWHLFYSYLIFVFKSEVFFLFFPGSVMSSAYDNHLQRRTGNNGLPAHLDSSLQICSMSGYRKAKGDSPKRLHV